MATANDNPPSIKGGNEFSFTVAENSTARIYDFNTADPDGDAPTYSLTGPDARFFEIDAKRGHLSFRDGADFEAPQDKNGNNVYVLNVVSKTRGLTDTVSVDVRVRDRADGDSAPTSSGNIFINNKKTSFTVDENDGDVFYDFNTTENSTKPVIYSLEGPDADDFSIDRATGKIRFDSAPDYERPADQGRDNTYNVTVRSTVGNETDTVGLAVKVADVGGSPPPSSPSTKVFINNKKTSFTVDENDDDIFYDFNTTENSNDPVVYSLGGDDAQFFDIDEATGKLRFEDAPDFEDPDDADGDNIYDLVVRSTVGNQSDAVNIAVEVENVGDSSKPAPAPSGTPEITNAKSSFSVKEGFSGEIYDFNTDVPGGGTVIYSLQGADAGDLEIDDRTGKLTFKTRPDFENPADKNEDNAYKATVVSTANGQEDRLGITVSVRNDTGDDKASSPSKPDAPNVDGYYATEYQNGNPYIKVQFEDLGKNPGGKWKYWSGADEAGKQSNSQGGYYEFDDGGYKNGKTADGDWLTNNLDDGLSYVVYVAEAGIYNLRVRSSRDTAEPSDRRNDIWVEIDDFDGKNEGYEDFVPSGTVDLVNSGGAAKLFGNQTNQFATNDGGFSRTVDSKSHSAKNPRAELDLDEGFYEITWYGRSEGYHIDYFELFLDDTPSLNAANSDFVPADDFGF